MARKLLDLQLSDADVDRFWRSAIVPVDPVDPDDCWGWRGYIHSRTGYAYVRAMGNSRPAHRVAYTIEIGPVPDGMFLDHLCRNRGCVNPNHVEPVTNRENLARSPLCPAGRVTCPKGHAYDAFSGGQRKCRTCNRENARARAARARRMAVSA